MPSGDSRNPTPTLTSQGLTPEHRERLERNLRIAARALQLCKPYRLLYAHVQRKCPGIDITKELHRVHAGEESAYSYLHVAWHWMSMVHPLGYVGPLAPEDREELDLDGIVFAMDHIRDFLRVFGVDAGELHGLPRGDVEDLGDGTWVSSDPRDATRVSLTLDLAMPDSELLRGIRLLRQVRGIEAGQVRPSKERKWQGEYGWREAFALLELARERPTLSPADLAVTMWPRNVAGKSAQVQVSRLLKIAQEATEDASSRVCTALDLRRRSAEARRNPMPRPTMAPATSTDRL